MTKIYILSNMVLEKIIIKLIKLQEIIQKNSKKRIEILYKNNNMCYNKENIRIKKHKSDKKIDKSNDKKEAENMFNFDYKALDISYYVINKFNSLDLSISNLKLQKILYFIQGNCLASSIGSPCFVDEIQAWRHGPVVPSVYYAFNSFLSGPILCENEPSEEIDDRYKKIIDDTIEQYKDFDAWELVEKTHQQTPWKSVYKEGKPHIIIPVELIKESFEAEI